MVTILKVHLMYSRIELTLHWIWKIIKCQMSVLQTFNKTLKLINGQQIKSTFHDIVVVVQENAGDVD